MKRSEHLEPLSHDHFEGLQVARRLRLGLENDASADEMTAYVVHFWDMYLTEHFRREEALLVAPLTAAGGGELAGQMMSEHRALAAQVEKMRGPESATESVQVFAEMLQGHIRFEERTVFPHLEEHVEQAVLERIGRQLHADHVDADLSWRVTFWA